MQDQVKVGVYLCHCGENIARVVDVGRVREETSKLPYVHVARDYVYMCSDPGQKLILDDIKELGVNRVVVASCSPKMHEPTFQKVLSSAGLNPYLLEMANIREHCSWPHENEPELATAKAIALVRAAVSKAALLIPLETTKLEVTKAALVIGGGIAGIRAALDIADAGFKVYLVERNPSIGGRMAQLDKTFPTLDCSQCILTPLMVDVSRHPNIELLTYSEVEDVEGGPGTFRVKIRKKARYIDEDKCTGCETCITKCPWKTDSEFEEGLGKRKAIYLPFPQAVPKIPVIDPEVCAYFKTGKCRACEKFCGAKAIDFEQQDQINEVEVGNVVVATGYGLYDVAKYIPEYGLGKCRNVLTGMHLERMASATGPTGGKIVRPSDGKQPESIAIILCVGSRDQKHLEYCCEIGCIAGLKHAYYVTSQIPDVMVYICYTDIRAYGKGYEEFYRRMRMQGHVNFIHGKPSEIHEDEDSSLYFNVFDLNTDKLLEVKTDLVVLETGIIPDPTSDELCKKLKIVTGPDEFFLELHPKLRPVETPMDGVFICGTAQGPKDIPSTVTQAGAAASKAIGSMARGFIESSPYVASVNESLCSGCRMCEGLCNYNAISMVERDSKVVATVDAARCKGCGVCAAACPAGCISITGWTDEQIIAMVTSILV